MRVNRVLLIVGTVFAIVGAGAVFFLSRALAPTPVLVVAAREDIPAGAHLSQIPEDAFVMVPLQPRSDALPMIESMLRPENLQAMRSSGGVFIRQALRFEPILLSSIVSGENPAAARVARLGLDDPNLMVVTISGGAIPDSIAIGDRVDLAVAVNTIGQPVVLDRAELVPESPPGASLINPVGSPEELLEELAAQSGVDLGALQETAAPTATPTSRPDIREPLAKVLVHASTVVRVIRERSVSSFTSQGETTVVLGEVIGLEVVIPRQAFETVAMASSAGLLQVGLLSPLADVELNGPTMGATLQDLLDLFYADRLALAPTPTASLTPAPTSIATEEPIEEQATPTATP
jgi:hypothetical protein